MSLGRVANIAANGSPDDANTYVAYSYLGASMVVDANHPAVPTGLKLTYGASANKANAPWHGHLARESQGRPGRALANSHGRDARVTHGQDAHATHGRDAHATPLYDQAGSNVCGPRPADPNANNAAHFRYDAWNRLATVHLDDGNTPGTLNGTNTLLATYRYDGLNRRVRKVTHADANTTTDYVFFNEGHGLRSLGEAGWQIVEVRRAVNAAPDANTTPYKQFVWDIRYIDAPVCRWWDDDANSATAAKLHYFTNDGNFNTTALVDANSGSVVERYLYDPYGKVTVLNASWTPISASAFDNEILYCGYRRDSETGLDEVKNRYYNWLTGRWQTVDPKMYGANLYQYCNASPATRLDAWGLKDYKVGTDDPQVTYDPDGGAFASKEWTWKWWYLKRVFLADLYYVESTLPDATAAMRHYFGASGSTHTINLAGMVRDVPSARSNYNDELAEAMKFAETLDLGEHSITSGAISDGYNPQSENLNWFLTTGGHSVWGKGKVTVSCPNGKKKYKLAFRYEFRDRYNWDKGKFVTVGGITIYDKWMLEFHLQGLAQHFNMIGSATATYEWEESKPLTPEPKPITVPSPGSGAGRGGRETGL